MSAVVVRQVERRAVVLPSIVVCSILFQDVFTNAGIPLVGYLDELIACFSFLYITWYAWDNRLSANLAGVCLCILLVLYLGGISTVFSDVANPPIPSMLDALSFVKVFVTFVAALIYFDRIGKAESVLRIVSIFCQAFILVALVFGVLNLFFDIGMTTDYRYGLPSYHFLFSRVGGLYMFCHVALAVIFLDGAVNGKLGQKAVWIAMTLLVMVLTLRIRAFLFAVVFLGLLVFVYSTKNGRLNLLTVAVLLALVLFVGFDQLLFYFVENDSQARSVLLRYGFETANAYFPLGSGFATYGTNMANLYGSDLYGRYGFGQYYGLGLVHSDYLTDNCWPAIFAETGYVGLVVYVAMVAFAFREAMSRTRFCKKTRFIVYYLAITLVISSSATTTFFTCSGAMILMALACSLSETAPSETAKG